MDSLNKMLLVNPKWLAEHNQDNNLIIVDCVADKHEYYRAHIPRSIMRPGVPFLKRVDEAENLPWITRQEDFEKLLYEMGIGQDTTVICYDTWGGYHAARFFWVASYYGFPNVKILDGGWQNWVNSGYPISVKRESAESPTTPFSTNLNTKVLITLDELKESYKSPDYLVLDTRSEDEYNGVRTYGNKRGGHIPGSIHLEWNSFLENSKNVEAVRKLRSIPELEGLLEEKGVTKEKTIVTYCQSAIRASHTAFVLHYLGFPHVRIYDGSMFEWANNDSTPLEV